MLKHGNDKGEGEDTDCTEDEDYTEDEGSTEVADPEAVTEERSLNTADWSSLEREHVINNGDTEVVIEVRSLNTAECLSLELEKAINEDSRRLALQHGSFTADPDKISERSANLPDFDGESRHEPSQSKQNTSPAAPSAAGVQDQSRKRKSASQSGSEAESEHVEKEPALDDYYIPGQPGHLVNPESRRHL